MNLDHYSTHIQAINEAIYGVKDHAKKLHELCYTFGQFDKEFSEHTLFEDFIVHTPNDSIDASFKAGASKEPISIRIEQIATNSKQRGYSMNKKNKWKTEIGRIGGLSVKEDSRILIKSVAYPHLQLEIKPIKELVILDETSMEIALEQIKNMINEKAAEIQFPIEATIEEDDLNGDDAVRLLLTSTVTGEDTNFKVIDENGKIAEQLGVKRETNMFNYTKGTDSYFEINGQSFTSSKNEVVVDQGNILISFRQLLLDEEDITFVPNSEAIYTKIQAFFLSLNPFLAFLSEHQEHLRSDLFKVFLAAFRERQEAFDPMGITLTEEGLIDIKELKLKEAIAEFPKEMQSFLFQTPEGFVFSLLILSDQILQKPFPVLAKEAYNPAIFIHPNTTTKINRNLKHTTFIDEEY